MQFRGADVSKMPLDWSCPIRCRIGEFMGQGDVWWALKDGTELQSAFAAISICLSEKAIPFLNGLNTDEGILALYDTGRVMGFGIDRDETRAVLLARAGSKDQASERLREYEAKWRPGSTSKRAAKFLTDYRAEFGCNNERVCDP
jgi:hypothetical protein